MIAITTLRRHPSSDVLFAGTFDGILIFQWVQSSFYFINLITTNSPTPVIDICFHRGKLYAVSEFKTALLVSFGNESTDQVVVRNTQHSKDLENQMQSRHTSSSQFTGQPGITYHNDQISHHSHSKQQGRDGSSQYPTFSLNAPNSTFKDSLQPNFGGVGSNRYINSITSSPGGALQPPADQTSTQYTKVSIDPNDRRLSQSSQKGHSEQLKIDMLEPSPKASTDIKIPEQLKPPPVVHSLSQDTIDPKNLKSSTGKLLIPVKDQSKGSFLSP